jgi:hypothetical protein
MSDFSTTWSFLREFFNYEHYADGIRRAQQKIERDLRYREDWAQIVQAVRNRGFAEGEPLELIHNAANQVLDENSDEEAYAWLDKMVENINRSDGVIDKY